MTRPAAWAFRSASTLRHCPCFPCGKTPIPKGQGYVTGLEPGTSFSYNRRYQRPLNLVPTIGPKEHKQFRISYSLLADKAAVDKALKQVSEIQAGGRLRCGRRRWLI